MQLNGKIFVIQPTAVYGESDLTCGLEIPAATLVYARQIGRLRFVCIAGRIRYLGSWIIDWLQAESRQEVEEPEVYNLGADARRMAAVAEKV